MGFGKEDEPKSIVTPFSTPLERANDPCPPLRTPKGQSPFTKVLMMIDTSSAVKGSAMHQGRNAALTDQYEFKRAL
jgi:hypothetical protein